ncbi:MAG: tRNA ((7)-)-methyltransferase [Pseudomonadota bacterium]|jgi:tRNA (guanine-N7-)-methyltransferase
MSEVKAGIPLRTVKSFVIRIGRMTTAQKQAYETNWPLHGLRVDDGALDPRTVFGREGPLVFEIGFGMGQSLIAMAQTNPDWNYIGVEVHPPGVGNLLRLGAEAQLTNLKVYKADAKTVLEDCVADNALDRVQIFFPDPWHKTRHHKRRLIQPDFIQDLRAKMKPGGILHLATDWEPYAKHMMTVLSAAEGFRNICGVGAYAKEHARPPTKFEQRGQRLGHGVWDLLFEKSA